MVLDLLPIATVLLLCLLHDIVEAINLRPIIDTDKGKVQGVTEFNRGNKVDKFLGIPYARPPLGDLRFKPPVQLDPWEGILDASHLPNACMQQKDTFFGNFTGSIMWNANTDISEDCLYLSVWVPRTRPPYKDKAVMVFIYGGSFFSGSHTLDIYNPIYLVAENDVVFVAMQYRVGSLGFLTLDTSEAPGNAGMWDQRMAMEWVSRNIHNFGGDAQKVTLVSESAGSVSVGLHLLSDVSRGYFHRAILQSGGPEAKWGALSKEEMWRRSESLANNLGCYKEGNPNYMIQCMRGKNASDLSFQEAYLTNGLIQFPFVPVVDGVFLRRDPQDLMRQGVFKKIPLLLGSNSNEITFFLVYHDNSAFNISVPTCEITRKQYRVLLRSIFKYYPHYPHELNEFGHDAIQYQYTNWLNAEDKIAFRESLDSAGSDAYFVCPVNRLARAYSRYDLPVYYYWFDQRWKANPWPEWMGVLHGDEFWFTFGQALNDSHSFTVEEQQLSKTMMRYWTNFAKTGDPNHAPDEIPVDEWPRFHFDKQRYINLSTKTQASGQTWGQGPRTQECAFWDFYLPKLVSETSDISDAEREWKAEFHTWKTRYIVDWKTQFDDFIHNYQRRTASAGKSCGDKGNDP